MALPLFAIGAVVGSFIGALTWRWPRNISIFDGRSRCPHCKHTIRWYDNIPLLSFLLLKGRCRDCKKKIPTRDFIIESSMALLFPVVYLVYPTVGANVPWLSKLPDIYGVAALLIIFGVCAAIFIVDLEHQYIPDTLVFGLLLMVIGILILTAYELLFVNLASGLGAGVFLLLIHLLTRGKGMGLGDVKLVLLLGTILGFPLAVVSIFSAFVIGSVVGIVLIVVKLAKLKQKVAFGPFLIVGFFMAMLIGPQIMAYLYF
jgi:leader peptidase (prepilin peptidase)/N-methyltransferase